MVVIKRFGIDSFLIAKKKKPTRSYTDANSPSSYSQNLTAASLLPTGVAIAAPLPPSTGALFPFCSTSPHLNHSQLNFSLHRCGRFKVPSLDGCKEW